MNVSPYDQPSIHPRRFDVMHLLAEASHRLAQAGMPTPRLDTELLLAFLLNQTRDALYRSTLCQLTPSEEQAYWKLIQRRAQREPIAYITGRRHFWKSEFLVTPDVLIPRPETEILVEQALDRLRNRIKPVQVLEVGTGSGVIAISLIQERPNVEIIATDISSYALAVAEQNRKRLLAKKDADRLIFKQSDGLEAFGDLRNSFDMILSNPPYIPTPAIKHLPADVKNFEPRSALDGGKEGLDVIRKILEKSRPLLTEDGLLLLEIGFDQEERVRTLLSKHGFKNYCFYPDLASVNRCLVATPSRR